MERAIQNIKIRLSDLILAFSRVLDYISPKVANHHLRVAVIASEIASEFGLPIKEIKNIFLASSLHDIGVFSAKEKFDALEFDMVDPHAHAERGYLLIKNSNLFSKIPRIIRCHHIQWNMGKGSEYGGEEVPIGSHILHLADRIEVQIKRDREILSQRQDIIDSIKSRSGGFFIPELVYAFERLASKEYFWFDVASPEIEQIIIDKSLMPDAELDIEEILSITRLFSNIIDYRSTFTAVHSAGVSAVAETLAQMTGFSEIECRLMRAAGYLHDIGKLAVPLEVLDKPAKLSVEEFNVIKSHVYHSYRILKGVAGLDTINTWASLHHERIDGTGYPFHLKGSQLPIGSRIMAVADVFTAITEDRPYRKGMSGEEALKVIENMAKNSVLDLSIVNIANSYFKHLNEIRASVQSDASKDYLMVKHLLK